MGLEASKPVLNTHGMIHAIQTFSYRYKHDLAFKEALRVGLISQNLLIPLAGTDEEMDFLVKCLEELQNKDAQFETMKNELSKEQAVRQMLISEYQRLLPGEPAEVLAEKLRITETGHIDLIANLRFEIFNLKFSVEEKTQQVAHFQEELRLASNQIDMVLENVEKEKAVLMKTEKEERDSIQWHLDNLKMQHKSLENIYNQSQSELKEVYLQLNQPQKVKEEDGIITILKRDLKYMEDKYQKILAENRDLLAKTYVPDTTSPVHQAYLISKLKADVENEKIKVQIAEEKCQEKTDKYTRMATILAKNTREKRMVARVKIEKLEAENKDLNEKLSEFAQEYTKQIEHYQTRLEKAETCRETAEQPKLQRIQSLRAQLLEFLDQEQQNVESQDSKLQTLQDQMLQKDQQISELQEQLQAAQSTPANPETNSLGDSINQFMTHLNTMQGKMEQMELSHKSEVEELKMQVSQLQTAPKLYQVYDHDLKMMVDVPILPCEERKGAELEPKEAEPEQEDEDEDSLSSGSEEAWGSVPRKYDESEAWPGPDML